MQLHFLLNMTKFFIHKTVAIHNNSVFVDDEKVFDTDAEEPIGSFLKQVYKNYNVGYSKYFKMDRLSKLGFLSAEILLNNTNQNNIETEHTSIILVNSAASLDTDHKFQDTVNDIASPAVFVYTLANIVIGEICIKHDIKGETAFFVQEIFNSAFVSNYANIVLSNSAAKNCIIGWIEVAPNGTYNSAMVMIKKEESELELNEINLNKIFN